MLVYMMQEEKVEGGQEALNIHEDEEPQHSIEKGDELEEIHNSGWS